MTEPKKVELGLGKWAKIGPWANEKVLLISDAEALQGIFIYGDKNIQKLQVFLNEHYPEGQR